MQLVREFYEAVVKAVSRIPLPASLRSIIYDTRFTARWVITNLNDLDSDDNMPEFYQLMFAEFDENADCEDTLAFECTSEDVHDPVENGEYLYYSGIVNPDIGVLYMQATHGWCLPSYLMICGPECQIEVSNCKIDILVYPVNTELRDILLTTEDSIREENIIEFLKNTERPRLSESGQDGLYFLTPR